MLITCNRNVNQHGKMIFFICGTAFELNTDFFSLPPPNEGPPEKGTRVYDGFTNGS